MTTAYMDAAMRRANAYVIVDGKDQAVMKVSNK